MGDIPSKGTVIGTFEENALQLTETFTDDVKCCLCLEEFTRPKILPCGHTFCLECLENCSDDTTLDNCPVCRHECRLLKTEIKNLPDNYLAKNMSEIAQKKRKLEERIVEVCDLCSLPTELECFCVNCEAWMCKRCTQSHTKIKDASGHVIKTSQLVNQELREQINIKCKTLEKWRTKISSDSEQNNPKSDGLIREIKSHTDILRKEIDRLEKKLLEEVENFQKKEKNVISSQKRTLSEISSYQTMINDDMLSENVRTNQNILEEVTKFITDHEQEVEKYSQQTKLEKLSWKPNMDVYNLLKDQGLGNILTEKVACYTKQTVPGHSQSSSSSKRSTLNTTVNNITDTNVYNDSQQQQLYEAAKNGRIDDVKRLLSQGVRVDSLHGDYKGTPLYWASLRGHTAVVKELLSHENNVNVADEVRDTPLHEASRNGYIDVVKELVSHGANTNVGNNYGYTPLHLASIWGRISVVKELLSHGGRVDIVNKRGKTALQEALQFNKQDVVAVLQSHRS